MVAGAFYRTTVLVSLDDADDLSDSYQLFKRCARILSTGRRVLHEGRITDAVEHRLFLIGADIAQR